MKGLDGKSAYEYALEGGYTGTEQDFYNNLIKEIPTKVSELQNDSKFITKAVNDLELYYLKSETYTQEEINERVSLIPKFKIEVVKELPTTNISYTTIYIVKNDPNNEDNNLFTEYIRIDMNDDIDAKDDYWEKLGEQKLDLSNYVLKNELPQSDYEENDSTSKTYILNRPFYETTEEVICEYDIQFDSQPSNSTYLYYIPNYSLTEKNPLDYFLNYDRLYKINLFDTDYILRGFKEDEDNDTIIFADPETNKTVIILRDEGHDWYALTIPSNNADPEGTITISSVPSLKQIDEKFIPNTIARISQLVGENVEGKHFTIGNYAIVAKTDAEIFNNYEQNIATGQYSHAEGSYTKAMGDNSHAEGTQTIVSGNGAHAEGCATEASGNMSHAEGYHTVAFGNASHAEGMAEEKALYLLGTAPTYTTQIDDTTGENVIYSIMPGMALKFINAEGQNEYAIIESLDKTNFTLTLHQYYPVPRETNPTMYLTSVAYEGSHVEGNTNTALGGSHAEGYKTVADGNTSHAEGEYTRASSAASHAEGYSTEANGYYGSHAEGYQSIANGAEGSHAEGNQTLAEGDSSHAEGVYTEALKKGSHTEGLHTIANSIYQHVEGQYNIEDSEDKYAHIVGNGNNHTERSNAHTLDWKGNAWFAGDVYVGGTSMEEAIKLGEGGKPSMTKIILTASGWINNTQTVTVKGILADETAQVIHINPVYSTEAIEAIGEAEVMAIAQGENAITFSCEKVPAINIEYCIVWQDVNYIIPPPNLIDFNYNYDEATDTYTLTSWKGTTNGVAGTEILVPNDERIII